MQLFDLCAPREHQITPEHLFLQRRRCLQAAAALALPWAGLPSTAAAQAPNAPLTALADITSYNNYYEFSTDKKAVKHLAKNLTLEPWTITVDGEVEKPYTIDATDLHKLFGTQERIYRLRCVEGWSMVIPWSGFALSKLIERARPTSNAQFVAFESLHRPSEMIGQRTASLPWPYREGLRIDEAMHPLAFAVTGLYGHPLPPQNGAPLRLALPWKYGFKSAKAITHIQLTRQQPSTSWSQLAPSEYGFYGNVNPAVAHPRWSQSRENRIGELQKYPTLPFNGYAQQVASLYTGLDPQRLF